MKKTGVAIFWGILIAAFLFSPSVSAAEEIAVSAAKYGVQYKTHVQDYGWEANWKSDGGLSGTVGEGKRLEALRVQLTGSNLPTNANIQTFVHIQNIGDRGPFEMDQMAGSEGMGLRLERITLYLNNLPDHQLRYNVQVQNKGWLRAENDVSTWFISGESAGTTGQGLRLEGIKIVVVEVNEAYDAYTKALAAVKQENYTTPSWNDYQLVVEENAVTSDDTSRDINKATAAVIAAQKFLEKASDMTAYNNALADANEADYTPDSWLTYQDSVSNNYVTKDDSQAAINAATKNILEAQKLLQRKINLTRYYELVDGAVESDYTPESWLGYQQVLADNVVTAASTQTQIDAAVKNITEAQKKMVRRLDFRGYNGLLKAVKEDDYTEKSWAAYQKVLDANVMTENNTQSEIAKAMAKIEAAQKKLIKAADTSAYDEALAAVSKENYTTASWAAYDKIVKASQVTAADSQTAIDAATKKILAAQLKLVELGNLSAYEKALAAVVKDNYTVASWAAYDKIVKSIQVAAADGQAAIDAATKKILAAQLKLVGIGDLAAYEEALAAVVKDDYTPTSWAAYDKIVKASKVTAGDGQVAIDAATKKILAAQLKLIEKGDLSAYQEVLAAVDQSDYTPTSWAAYQKVVAANIVTAASSQDAVEKAIAKIVAAQFNLARAGDLTNYKNALEAVKQANYTTASWSAYQKVVKANVMTANNTQADIGVATANIIAAQESLEFKSGDIRAYEATLAKAKQADYTTVSWTAYQNVVKANVVTGENKQTEIDQATKNIQAAQAALVKKGDLTSYNIALAGLDEADYTAATWKAYQLVVKANIRTAEDPQAAIDASTTKILAAQKTLVKVGDLTAYNAALAAARKENYTTATWNAYQNVVKANVRTKNDTQLLIDDAVKKILAAQKSLVRKYDTSAYNALLAAVKEANYTPASWTDYQKVVKAYPATYSPIQTAIEKIEAAQAKLVKAVDLTAYKNALAMIKDEESGEYAPDSWKAYQVELQKPINKMTAANSQAEIDAATKRIQAAQKELKKRVNLTDYLKLREAVIEYDYSPTSWVVYQQVLADNVVTENNTQAEVNAATEKIRVAQNKLVRRLDYSKYDALRAAVPDTVANKALYTTVSWGVYQDVLKKNELTKKEDKETQTQIDKAVANIEAAQKKLVKAGDLTAYDAVRKAVEGKRGDYTTVSWDVYLKVLEANEMTVNHSQAEIDAATDKIRLAQLKLAKAGSDMDEYNELTTDLDPVDYTSVSWAIYQKAIDANYVTAQDGQSKINAAVVKLREAKRKLVPRAEDFTEYDKVRTEKDASKYTTSSWAIYQKVLDANAMDADKSQAQVDVAVANIKKAQFKLLEGGDLKRYNELLNYNIILGKDPAVTTDPALLKKMLETDYTSASWAIYAKVLSSNEMDRDKSQAQIDAAVVKIERAQQKLALKGDVSKYNDTLAKNTAKNNIPMQEADYTEKSWLVYEKLLKAKGYFVTSDNSQAEIDRAVELVKAAQRELKNKGNIVAFIAARDAKLNLEAIYTTKTWNEYLAVLKKYNAISAEDTQVKIDAATNDIINAQARLILGAEMATYDDVLGRVNQADYTATSWTDYMKVVLANTKTKDDPQLAVTNAAKVIEAAQLKLVRSNQTELAAFEETLDLYQRNIIYPGTIAAKATNWNVYSAIVEANAGFDSSGKWIPTTITKDTAPGDITKATKDIDTAIRGLIPSAATGLNTTAYTAAKNTLVDLEGSAATYVYTKNSYRAYVQFCKNNQLPIRNLIEATPTQIDTATSMIGIGLLMLKDAASTDEINAYQAEMQNADTLRQILPRPFTDVSWKSYSDLYTNTAAALNPDENSKQEYTTVTKKLQDARLALFAKSPVENIYLNTTAIGQIATGTNVVDKAKTVLGDKGFTTANYTITFAETGTNTATNTSDVISGTPGQTLTGTFTITPTPFGTTPVAGIVIPNVVFTIV